MRCRKGDLAIVLVGSYSGSEVTVIKYLGTVYRVRKGDQGGCYVDDCWETTAPKAGVSIPGSNGRWAYRDSELLPIRPDDLKETEETEKEIEHV